MQKALYFIRWQLYPIILAVPAHLAFVFRGWRHNHCPVGARLKLAGHSIFVHLKVECGHNPKEVLHVIEEIVGLAAEAPGVILECGAFNGGSTAKLSRAASVAGRKLIVCDSFAGLPEVGTENHTDTKPDFQKGEYLGQLTTVKKNLIAYGDIDCVEFVPGWYEETLPRLGGIQIACAFWDVDLQESFRSCIKGLWRQVNPGAKVFIHDIDRTPVVDAFTDSLWWAQFMNAEPPQMVGAYRGLSSLSPLIGYVVKNTV